MHFFFFAVFFLDRYLRKKGLIACKKKNLGFYKTKKKSCGG